MQPFEMDIHKPHDTIHPPFWGSAGIGANGGKQEWTGAKGGPPELGGPEWGVGDGGSRN